MTFVTIYYVCNFTLPSNFRTRHVLVNFQIENHFHMAIVDRETLSQNIEDGFSDFVKLGHEIPSNLERAVTSVLRRFLQFNAQEHSLVRFTNKLHS